jgi:hypothetical protein
VDFSSLSFLLETEENHCSQEKHHCHHDAVVVAAKLSEEQEELQRIDWVPDEILLPTPRREQREQQFHEHCLMMDALRHSIHSLAFFANSQKTQHEKKQNMRVNQNLLLRTHFEGRHH